MKPFDASSRAAALVGPNALMPAAVRSSTMPARQRRFRSDHDELNRIGLAKRDHRCMVGDVERDAFGLARDAGIARRAIKFVDQRTRGDFPRQRVFASARAEDQYVHGGRYFVDGCR